LHGVPIAVKDLCHTAGIVTAAGMVIHKDFVPERDATVVSRLKAAGAVLLGKLQLTEGAFSTHHPSIKPPVNPWSAAHWPAFLRAGPAWRRPRVSVTARSARTRWVRFASRRR
jgi:amidase